MINNGRKCQKTDSKWGGGVAAVFAPLGAGSPPSGK